MSLKGKMTYGGDDSGGQSRQGNDTVEAHDMEKIWKLIQLG